MLQIRHNHEGWNQNIFIKINWHVREVVNIKLGRYKSNHKNRLFLFNFWTNNTEPWDRRETSRTDDNLCWTQIELSGHLLTREQRGDAEDRRLDLDNYDHWTISLLYRKSVPLLPHFMILTSGKDKQCNQNLCLPNPIGMVTRGMIAFFIFWFLIVDSLMRP